MQSKLPITLGRAFLAAFFADLRFPMVVHPSPSLPAHEPSLPTKSLQSKGPEGRGLLAACRLCACTSNFVGAEEGRGGRRCSPRATSRGARPAPTLRTLATSQTTPRALKR
jgi:hypothetical protein